jgi:hypothetical protein
MFIVPCKIENKYVYFLRASHNIDEQGRGTRFSASKQKNRHASAASRRKRGGSVASLSVFQDF